MQRAAWVQDRNQDRGWRLSLRDEPEGRLRRKRKERGELSRWLSMLPSSFTVASACDLVTGDSRGKVDQGWKGARRHPALVQGEPQING